MVNASKIHTTANIIIKCYTMIGIKMAVISQITARRRQYEIKNKEREKKKTPNNFGKHHIHNQQQEE